MVSKKQFCFSLEKAHGNLVALHTTMTSIVLKVLNILKFFKLVIKHCYKK